MTEPENPDRTDDVEAELRRTLDPERLALADDPALAARVAGVVRRGRRSRVAVGLGGVVAAAAVVAAVLVLPGDPAQDSDVAADPAVTGAPGSPCGAVRIDSADAEDGDIALVLVNGAPAATAPCSLSGLGAVVPGGLDARATADDLGGATLAPGGAGRLELTFSPGCQPQGSVRLRFADGASTSVELAAVPPRACIRPAPRLTIDRFEPFDRSLSGCADTRIDSVALPVDRVELVLANDGSPDAEPCDLSGLRVVTETRSAPTGPPGSGDGRFEDVASDADFTGEHTLAGGATATLRLRLDETPCVRDLDLRLELSDGTTLADRVGPVPGDDCLPLDTGVAIESIVSGEPVEPVEPTAPPNAATCLPVRASAVTLAGDTFTVELTNGEAGRRPSCNLVGLTVSASGVEATADAGTFASSSDANLAPGATAVLAFRVSPLCAGRDVALGFPDGTGLGIAPDVPSLCNLPMPEVSVLSISALPPR